VDPAPRLSRSVLVVDDQDEDREYARRILERAGHTVHAADDVYLALKAFRAGKPDVILLDLVLPFVDGFELLRLLRTDLEGVRVIAMSAQRLDEMTAELCKRAGFAAFLIKPLVPEELLAWVSADAPAPSVH
jgi:CheY-like chemotaxis protein